MNLDLAGKVALVSGSCRGIGKAVAVTLGREGCRVLFNGRDEKALEAAVSGQDFDCATFCGDISDPATARGAVAAAVARWGSLDVLVANVGSGSSPVPLGAESESEWLRVLRVNLLSATNLVEAALPEMEKNGGSILCVSSICGLYAMGAPIAYSAAKAALNSYVQGMARPLAKKGIRLNAILPGNILFPGGSHERRLRENPDAVKSFVEREVPMTRFGTPEEIADFAAFLSSPRAGFSTGALFVVDGGQARCH